MTALAVLPKTRLTDEERNNLKHCEQIIDRGIKIYYEVGDALACIHENRLYRETHTSFESYCRERWQMGRTRAYQYIDASEVHRSLSKRVDTPPEYESHARPLTSLAPDAQVIVWDVVNAITDGKPTTKKVNAIATVFKEFAQTGAIDDGTGNDIPLEKMSIDHFKAAVIEEVYERMQRQKAHIEESEKKASAKRVQVGRVTLRRIDRTTLVLEGCQDLPAYMGQSYRVVLYKIQD